MAMADGHARNPGQSTSYSKNVLGLEAEVFHQSSGYGAFGLE